MLEGVNDDSVDGYPGLGEWPSGPRVLDSSFVFPFQENLLDFPHLRRRNQETESPTGLEEQLPVKVIDPNLVQLFIVLLLNWKFLMSGSMSGVHNLDSQATRADNKFPINVDAGNEI